MSMLDGYEPFVGRGTLDELRLLGRRLQGRRIVTINSTAVGGGVAEILSRAGAAVARAGCRHPLGRDQGR